MLNDTDYRKGLTMLEQIRYNINYDRQLLMDIVISSLARTLLDCSYSKDLTEEQRETLSKITSK